MYRLHPLAQHFPTRPKPGGKAVCAREDPEVGVRAAGEDGDAEVAEEEVVFEIPDVGVDVVAQLAGEAEEGVFRVVN